MSTVDLAYSAAGIVQKARITFIATLLFLSCVSAGLVFFSFQVSHLRNDVSRLKRQSIGLQEDVAAKKIELLKIQDRTNQSEKGLQVLQYALRDLFYHHYEKAVAGYQEFVKLDGASSEALTQLGYAELRLGRYWQENGLKKNVSPAAKTQYESESTRAFFRSTQYFMQAAKKDPGYLLPAYLLSVSEYEQNAKEKSLLDLQQTLKSHPETLDWLCDDGDFRVIRLDADVGSRFVDIVNAARGSAKGGCWVINTPLN